MATNADLVLDALGDPTRRAVLELLQGAPSAVGQLAEQLPVSRPAVSQHLAVLARAGLVSAEAVGTRRVYAVRRDGLAVLRDWLDLTWQGALTACAAAVDGDPGDPDEKQ